MTHNHFSLLLLWITCLGFVLNPNRLLRSEPSSISRLSPFLEMAQAQPSSLIQSRYDRLMQDGYEATEQRDYQTALQKFQQALAERPDDSYAQQAISNITTYLSREPIPSTPENGSWLWGKLGLMAIALGGAGIIVYWWKFRSPPSAVESGVSSFNLPSPDSPSPNNTHSPNEEIKQTPRKIPQWKSDSISNRSQPQVPSWQQTNRLPNLDLVNELIKDLQEPNARIRHRAIRELTQRGDSRAVKPLVELIIHSNSLERSLVLEALTQISIRTLQPMNQALTASIQDESALVRTNAIRELSQVYDLMSQVNQLLSHATEDSDTEVQEIARRALNQMTLNQLLFNADG